MDRISDYLYRYTKGGSPGVEGLCRVRLYTPAASGALGASVPVVVCSEPPLESGYAGPSVTNEAELIAAGVVDRHEALARAVGAAERASGDSPAPFYFVEHYPRGEAERRAGLDGSFDFVTFDSYEPVRRGMAGLNYRTLGSPEWQGVSRERVERMTGDLFEPEAEAAYFAGLFAPESSGLRGGPGETLDHRPNKAPRGGHCRIEILHGMLAPLPWDPAAADVVLKRVPDFEAGLDLGNRLSHKVQTNVPWSVVEHSPDGFSWGYAGSGPADLALNILNALFPPGSDGRSPVSCYEGEASGTAYALHQRFKEDFLAGVPWEGGSIPGTGIRAWIERRVVRAGTEVVGFVTATDESPGDQKRR